MADSENTFEVTMAAASFTTFHPLAFQYVEALLSRTAYQNHPFRGEWQAYKDCAKGLTANSTWYAVKTIMGLTNIDDYKNVLNRCPGINQYLHIRRTNQRFNSKITCSVLKPVPDIPITPTAVPITHDSDHPSASVRHVTHTAPQDNNPQARPRNTMQPNDQNITTTVPDAPRSPSPARLTLLQDGYAIVTANWADKSFEQFFYQAFPIVNAWCAANPTTSNGQVWDQAIKTGLPPIASWTTVSQALAIENLRMFYTFLTKMDTVQRVFDLQWISPNSFSYRQEHASASITSDTATASANTTDRTVTHWISQLQQRYESAAAQLDTKFTDLQDKVIGSTTRLENFINSYNIKIQNMSHDIATFDNTFLHKSALAYDKITEASNKAVHTIKTSMAPLLQEAKELFRDYTQEQINEADRIYEDLVEQAVSSIYDTTQEALDQIADQYDDAKQPAMATPSHTTRPISGDVRNHTPVDNPPPRFPTPWSTKRQSNDASARQPTRPASPPVQQQHVSSMPDNTEINIISPVSPFQMDHQKFIKYVEVTYCGNIFEFYNKLQNFCLHWGVALKGIDDIKHGQSLCPELVNGTRVTPSDYKRMSHALYEKLQSTECIPPSYSALRNAINRYSKSMDGYKTLYDILEDYLPSLKKEPEFPAPHSDDFANIHEYANQFDAFLTFESLSDPPRLYNDRAKIRKFISGLGPAYANAIPRLEALLDAWHEPNPTPWMLELNTLPKTIDKYVGGNAIIRAAQGFHKNDRNTKHQAHIDAPSIPAPDKDACGACHIRGHTAVECHAWGKTLLLSRFSRNAPEASKTKAINNYLDRLKQPRPKRSQMRATVRKLVEDNNVDDILALFCSECSDDETPAPQAYLRSDDE